MAVTSEEPLISRLERLDNMVRQLEEMRGCKCNSRKSPRSSSASSGNETCFTTEGHADASSDDFSPTSLENHCRPIDYVMVETQVKGTLIQRLHQVEDRLLKLEGELEAEKKKEENNSIGGEKRASQKKGIKQFVKQCLRGKQYPKLK